MTEPNPVNEYHARLVPIQLSVVVVKTVWRATHLGYSRRFSKQAPRAPRGRSGPSRPAT